MERDEMSLADNFAGSNTDEDEIDSDLEDKLYAAVFHSNDVSKPNQEDIATITDVISSWKNIPADEPSVHIPSRNNEEKSIGRRSEGSVSLRLADAGRYETFVSKNKNNGGRETRERANRNESESDRRSPLLGVTKKHKNTRKASWNFKDLEMFDDVPPRVSVKNGNGDDTAKSATVAPENSTNEPLEIKSEEENSIEKEQRLPWFDDTVPAVEGSIKPEEEKEIEKVEPIESTKAETTRKAALNSSSEASLNFTPLEDEETAGNGSLNLSLNASLNFSPLEDEEAAGNRSLNLSSNASLNFSPLEDGEAAGNGSLNLSSNASLNFSPLEDEETTGKGSLILSSSSSLNFSALDHGVTVKIRPVTKQRSKEVIIIEDSEDSIFEIPVPPKPRPPTINLDDSESSTSSDSESDAENEAISPQKLIEDYKLAISESSKSLRAKSIPEATKQNTSSSDSDVSTSDSEEDDWGIIPGSQINKDKSSPVDDEIVEELNTSSQSMSKEPETVMDEEVEKDTLIINAESSQSRENFGSDSLARTPENRKRSISDSGKKSKRHSPKKAKSSGDPGASTSRKDDKHRERNCADDYLFRPMTTEMENYYNNSWGGENFDLDAVRRDMPRDPRQWAILNEDLLGNQQRKSRYWTESKCRNCNHTGHHMAECPEKRKLPVCHMCGTQGHREPRCPHKMCLGCGKKQKTYMQVCNGCRKAWCSRCQSYGHVEDSCPDLWRRYHMTTSYGDDLTHVNATDVMKPVHMLSCCNCAQRGHDSTTCHNYRWSRHFPTPAFVTSYTTGPAYTHDIEIEDLDYSSETREETETERSVVPSTSSLSSDGKRFSPSEATDTHVEQSKKTNKHPEKVQSPLDTRKGREILFKHKSLLVDAEFERAINFGKYTVPLTRVQCSALVESDLSRQFLMNLISQFPIKLEIKHCSDGNAKMLIRSTTDLHGPIQLTIMDWLKWPVDERSRFVNLNLPTTKDELIKLLTEKLEELNQYLGDPMVLNNNIISLKSELKRLQRQSESGQKLSTCSKRARVVEELAKSQCKLNMILMGQTNVKSSKFLRITLSEMLKPGSSNYINATTYLQIVHHYNIVFSAYTAENVPSLLNNYFQKNNIKSVQKGKRDTVYNNFLKIINPLNKTPTSAGSNVSSSKPRKQTPKDKGVSPFKGTLHLKNRVGATPERAQGDSDTVPLMFDLDRLENNYYNSRYNFGENVNRRQEKNRGQEDYIALQNNHYNVEKDWTNAVVNDCSKRSRRRHRNKSMPRHGVNDPLENGFPSYQRDASSGNNRGHDNYVPRNTSLRDIFLYDNQPERSGHANFLRDSNRGDVVPLGDRRSGNFPSTSTSTSPSGSNIFGNKRSLDDQSKSITNKNKKKKKNKGAKLTPYLQKRAAKNIAKYIDIGVPRITQAAKELQKKVSDNQITLQCVQKFEGLVKRKLKRTDHLL